MGQLQMDRGGVESYLRHRMPEAGDLQVVGITKFPRGVSRETYFVDAEFSQGRARKTQGFVFRRDLVGRSICPTSLRFEYEIYRRLHGTEVPVARPLWYEEDPDWMIDGREFYVRERVDGTWEVPSFMDPDPRYDDLRIAVCQEHARKLAMVHNIDWLRLGFGEIMDVPETPAANATTAVDRLERTLRSFQVEPFPVVTEALCWLRENAPKSFPRTCLLKGNNGLGEEIWHDGKIVAMSDWELASLGDPAYDWAWLQTFVVAIPGRWDEQRYLDYYEQVSGIHIEPSSLRYYRTIAALERLVFSHNAALPVINKENYLARLCWVSTEVLYGSQMGLAAAAGILAPR